VSKSLFVLGHRTVLTHRLELSSVADTALKAVATFWFVVTVSGQLLFAFSVSSFYSPPALRGDHHLWRFTNGLYLA
jgi:membrane-anchored protein YejM (alkaline phosphatase superfamily)